VWRAILKSVEDTRIRSVAVALLLLGFTYASTFPYQSIIGINQLGLTEAQMGLLIFAVGLTGMIGNLLLGHFSDFARDRKSAILFSLCVGAVGFGCFALWPSLVTFLICLLLVMPISGSTYSQLFAVVRTITAEHGPREAASINSAIRAFYALSWILVPGLVGVFIATRKNVSDSFAIAALAFALCFGFYALFGPSGGRNEAASRGGWVGLREAFSLIFEPRVFKRVMALSFIQGPHPFNAALLPLLITSLPHGSTADVGILAGVVAALEIPLMLLAAALNRNWHTWILVTLGGASHITYLLCLSAVTNVHTLYLLAGFNAAGAAILLTLHMSYVQELLPQRPGLATSLLSIVSLVSRGLAALVFAGIGLVYAYGGAVAAMALVVLAGCSAIIALDFKGGARRRFTA
jgi:MFS family permease